MAVGYPLSLALGLARSRSAASASKRGRASQPAMAGHASPGWLLTPIQRHSAQALVVAVAVVVGDCCACAQAPRPKAIQGAIQRSSSRLMVFVSFLGVLRRRGAFSDRA